MNAFTWPDESGSMRTGDTWCVTEWTAGGGAISVRIFRGTFSRPRAGVDIAEREGLPSLEDRSRQLKAIVDAYGLSAAQRRSIVDLIIGYAIHDAAEQADAFGVTPYMVDPMPDGYPIIWGLTWRARSAAWVYRNRDTLEKAIT